MSDEANLRKLGLGGLASWLGQAQSASKRNVAKLESFAERAFKRVNREFKKTIQERSVNPDRDQEGPPIANSVATGDLRDSLEYAFHVSGRGKSTNVSIRIFSNSPHYAQIDNADNRQDDFTPERTAEWLEQKFGIPNLWATEAAGSTTKTIDAKDYPKAAARGFEFVGPYRLLVLSIHFKVMEREQDHFYQGLHLTDALRESLSIRRGKSGLVQRLSEVIKSTYAFDPKRRDDFPGVPF